MTWYCRFGLILIELCFYFEISIFFDFSFYDHIHHGRDLVKQNHCVPPIRLQNGMQFIATLVGKIIDYKTIVMKVKFLYEIYNLVRHIIYPKCDTVVY